VLCYHYPYHPWWICTRVIATWKYYSLIAKYKIAKLYLKWLMRVKSHSSTLGHFNLISCFTGKNIRNIGPVGRFKNKNIKIFNNLIIFIKIQHTKNFKSILTEFSKCTGPITSNNLLTNNARNPMPNRTTRPCPRVGQRRCHFICARARYKSTRIFKNWKFKRTE